MGERDACQYLTPHTPPPALQGNQPNMTPPFEAPLGTGKFWALCWWGQGGGQGLGFAFIYWNIVKKLVGGKTPAPGEWWPWGSPSSALNRTAPSLPASTALLCHSGGSFILQAYAKSLFYARCQRQAEGGCREREGIVTFEGE